jgi:hypothetical protein
MLSDGTFLGAAQASGVPIAPPFNFTGDTINIYKIHRAANGIVVGIC